MRALMLVALLAALAGPAFAQQAFPPGYGASPEAVAAAARPGDEALTCQQIGAELAPFFQQMMGSYQSNQVGENNQAMMDLAERRRREALARAPGQTAAAIAGSVVPGVGAAAAATEVARAQQQMREDAPVRDRAMQSTQGFAGDMDAMLRANPRAQHLMMLGQRKGCQ